MAAEIYTRLQPCPYCEKAKELLKSIGIHYTEHVVGKDLTRDEFLATFPDTTSVPQILINGKYIGGYDKLLVWKEESFGGYTEQEL